eukprot:305163-Pleurochrysis_carterae.AAC.1
MPLRRVLSHRHAQVGATSSCRALQCCECVAISSKLKPSRRSMQLHVQLHSRPRAAVRLPVEAHARPRAPYCAQP